jgi:hypothetical protein
MNDFAERVRARLFRRRDAYRAVFSPMGDLGPMAEIVMRDLARYCHVDRANLIVSPVTRQADPIAMAFAEGQRDVFNRIQAQLHLSPDQINRIAYAKDNE